MIDLIAFSFTINWHLCLNSKKFTYLSLYHFFWALGILVIPILKITPTRDHLTWPPHVIISYDLLTWSFQVTFLCDYPQLNLTHKIKSIKHLFAISLKAQLFSPSICSVITWPITWSFRSSWASSLINLVELLALGWPFYNFKSFKLNRSASPFRKKKRKYLATLIAFIRAFYLNQCLDPLLATLFLKIFFLAAKTSLLALPSSRPITLPPYHMPPLPLLLHRFSLLCLLLPNT